MNDVSIILVSYNTKDLTQQCIESVYKNTDGLSFEVFCVDNCSQDGSVEMIREKFPQVKLIASDKNNGFGAANNLAIQKCNSKYIFFLNTDTLLKNNAIKILFEFIESNEKIAAAGGNLYDDEDKNILSYGWFPTVKSKFIKAFLLNRIVKFSKTNDRCENKNEELKEVDFVSGADLMVRKSVLDEVGFFDEDFFLYYEDVELQYRIKKAGHKIYINPNAKIAHLEGASSKNRVVRRKYALEAEYLFFKKAYNLSKFSLVKILFFMSHLLRFCTNPKMILQVWRYICKA